MTHENKKLLWLVHWYSVEFYTIQVKCYITEMPSSVHVLCLFLTPRYQHSPVWCVCLKLLQQTESICFIVSAMIIEVINTKQKKYIRVCYQKFVILTKSAVQTLCVFAVI